MFAQFLKASRLIDLMLEEIFTSSKLVQPSKRPFAILLMLVVNTNDLRDEQFLKQSLPIVFTPFGMEISSNEEQSSKALPLIRSNELGRSTYLRLLQPKKVFAGKVLIPLGTTIFSRAVHFLKTPEPMSLIPSCNTTS